MKFWSLVSLASLMLTALPLSAHATVTAPSVSSQTPHLRDFDPLRPPSLSAIAQGAALEYGHASPLVEEIRSLLIHLGYPVAPSGQFFDRDIAFQIGAFQAVQHLASPDSPHYGRLGQATLDALRHASRQRAQAEQLRYNVSLGQQLAHYARGRVSGTRRYCYHYVARAISAHMGPFLSGLRAYMAADQLAASGYFREIQISSSELPKLPAGAVVVWEKGRSASGHISIADGKGFEISDHIQPQMQSHYGGGRHRVFLPLGRS
ncbi:MAG: peptidoglycan-binding domain-containing protein [Candidatus Sericytochromatia bacterium]